MQERAAPGFGSSGTPWVVAAEAGGGRKNRRRGSKEEKQDEEQDQDQEEAVSSRELALVVSGPRDGGSPSPSEEESEDSSMKNGAGAFYAYWLDFQSRRPFSEEDLHDPRHPSYNRRDRRYVEKLNE